MGQISWPHLYRVTLRAIEGQMREPIGDSGDFR
jgi:hypothetical protein